MRVIYKIGNLVEAPEFVIAHGCNAQGVMGSGVAKAIRETWPEAFEEYRWVYENNGLELGTVVWVITSCRKKLIGNCITQEYYGRDGKLYVDYNAIRKCMNEINQIAKNCIGAVAMPMIGSGLGGGDWTQIQKIIEEEITDTQPYVYALTEKDIPDDARSR